MGLGFAFGSVLPRPVPEGIHRHPPIIFLVADRSVSEVCESNGVPAAGRRQAPTFLQMPKVGRARFTAYPLTAGLSPRQTARHAFCTVLFCCSFSSRSDPGCLTGSAIRCRTRRGKDHPWLALERFRQRMRLKMIG